MQLFRSAMIKPSDQRDVIISQFIICLKNFWSVTSSSCISSHHSMIHFQDYRMKAMKEVTLGSGCSLRFMVLPISPWRVACMNCLAWALPARRWCIILWLRTAGLVRINSWLAGVGETVMGWLLIPSYIVLCMRWSSMRSVNTPLSCQGERGRGSGLFATRYLCPCWMIVVRGRIGVHLKVAIALRPLRLSILSRWHDTVSWTRTRFLVSSKGYYYYVHICQTKAKVYIHRWCGSAEGTFAKI